MFTRGASCSSSLITTPTLQHRNVATKLATKWTPSHPPTPSQPPAPSVPSRPPIPTSNIGKWARPGHNRPPATTGATAPGKWAIPELKPAAPRQRPKLQSEKPTTSQMPQFNRPPLSLGKWATPISESQQSGSSSSRPPAGTYRLRSDPRLDRDIAPHQGIVPRDMYSDFRSAPRDSQRDHYKRGSYDSRQLGSDREVDRQRTTESDDSVETDTNQAHLEPGDLEHREDARPTRYRDVPAGRSREKYKTRGSLREGGEIERRSRVSDVRAPKVKKLKPKRKVFVTEDVFIPTVVSVGQLARLLGVRLEPLQRKMFQAGMGEESSYDYVLNSEYASMLALEFNKNPIVNDEAAFDIFPPPPHPDPSSLPLRPPVVTIMGHVDHGKTTLLDTLRSSSVAKGEAGGITQHIGAFSVPVPATSNDGIRTITFLDTPGHAAFSAMRARGASVTDIVVLVVAADDGVMPQTKEVIDLIKRDDGKVGVVVAINKIDKPGVDSEAIQHSLLAEGVQLETLGGDIPSVEVSGLTGLGLDRLVETISAVAEMADYRAEAKGNVFGYVLESKVLKGLGPVATVLVLRGDLTPTKNLISGTAHARVRQLSDSAGKVVKAAYPGMAVTVSGWKELPSAGDEVMQGSESDIKKAIANRRRRAQLAAIVQDAEAINLQRRQDREKKEDAASSDSEETAEKERPEESNEKKEPNEQRKLRLVVKGDVSGSVEAVSGALEGIGNKEAAVKIVQSSVGNVTESDIMMAKTAEGMIVAFSVTVPRAIETLAAVNNVPILTSSVIYRLMDDIKQKVVELLPPIIEKRVTGEATVQQLFDIKLKRHETIKVAGCRVTNGLMEKSKTVRIMRDGISIHEGSINTFRHLKKDVIELRKDMECGISLHNFEDLQAGDVIQAVQVVQKPGVL